MPAITLAPSVQVSTMMSPNRISARLSAGSRKRLRYAIGRLLY
jgi:hypothetical protein